MKKLFYFLILLLLLAAAAVAGFFFIEVDDEQYALLDFVPTDFVYLIESDEPVEDWQELSRSKVWQSIKNNSFFADITENADYLDSLLSSNEVVVGLVKIGSMAISAHMISTQESDFLILVDLKGKGRKAAKSKPVITQLLSSFDYEVSTENYINNTIYKLYDPAYKESMYMAVVGNVLLFSYTESLLKKGILQNGQPSIRSDADFLAVKDKADAGELYSIYLNYQHLNRLINSYSSEPSEMLAGLNEILTYSVWDLRLDDDHVEMDGYVRQNDSVPSYLTVFGTAGQGKIGAPGILPSETATFTSMGFSDFSQLYLQLMQQLEQSSPEEHREMVKRKGQLEKLLKIDVERDLFDWMTEEVVTAVVPVDQGRRYASYALLHFDDYALTKERLDYLAERIGRTMVKFEEIDYRGFPIRYLELKGFFKLFFKKLFSKIEQPHYTYLDNYVVFSNDTSSLQLLIDRYLEQNTLKTANGFDDFIGEFSKTSNIFHYYQAEPFYGYLAATLDVEARMDLQKSRNDFLAFPHFGFQLFPSSNMYRTTLYSSFTPPNLP